MTGVNNDFLSETMETRRQWNDISKMLGRKSHIKEVKITFSTEDKIKTFSER